LIGNDPAHRFGGLACLLRQIEHAAAQLLARLIEFALNLARHVLHFGDRLTEAVSGVFERPGQLRVGLFESRLQCLCGSLAFLGRRVANAFKLAGDRNRRAPCRGCERGADLLSASLGPGETVFDIRRESPKRRFKSLAAAREVADECLQAAVAVPKGVVERLLLPGEILPDLCERLRMLRELSRERAGVGLGGG
jgi:hypothetical protein